MGVAGIGEFELIARLVESVEAARRERSVSWGPQVHLGSGDDAAITVPAAPRRPRSTRWSTASTSVASDRALA